MKKNRKNRKGEPEQDETMEPQGAAADDGGDDGGQKKKGGFKLPSIFGGKKNQRGGDEEDEVQPAPVAAAPMKPSESLGTVLSESVPSASLDLIRSNDSFCYPAGARDQMTCYVVVTLDVRDIGGLNKHMKSDPDKGQFIECIMNGNIEAHVSEDGIKAGTFVIIPSERTLRTISEFAFLAEPSKFAKFIPTLVHVDGNGNMEFEELRESRVDFKWLVDLAKKRVGITEAMRKLAEDAAVSAAVTAQEEAAIQEQTAETVRAAMAVDEDDPFAGSETDGDSDAGSQFMSSFFGAINLPPPEEAPPPEQTPVPSAPPVTSAAPVQPASEPPVQPVQQPQYAPPPAQPQYPQQPAYAAPPQYPPQNQYPPQVPPQYPQYQQAPLPQYNGIPYGGAPNINYVECPQCSTQMDPDGRCPSCGFSFNDSSAASRDDGIDEVSDEEVAAACERLFYASGLELQITAQPFDMQFMQGNGFVPIAEDRADGWLNGYVTQMVKNANAELRKLHKQNLFRTRNRFLTLMTEACEDISRSVDPDDPATPYYGMKRDLMERASSARASIEGEVDRRRSDMRTEWEAEMKQMMDSAAQAAKRTYLDKHSAEHEAKLRDVEISLLDNIEIDYQRDMATLHERRRDEAKALLDQRTTQTLRVLAEHYQELLDEEERARAEVMQAIQDYLDEHRKDETARMEVLAEGQRQQEEAERVTADYERRLKTIAAEHDATCDKYIQELSAARTHEESIKAEYQARYAEFEKKYGEMDDRYNALLDRYTTLDAAKNAEYESRITALREDKRAAEEHLAHVDTVHNKYNKVSLGIWAAIALATFCVGLLLGVTVFQRDVQVPDGHYVISVGAPEAAGSTQSQMDSDLTQTGGAGVTVPGGEAGDGLADSGVENFGGNADDTGGG